MKLILSIAAMMACLPAFSDRGYGGATSPDDSAGAPSVTTLDPAGDNAASEPAGASRPQVPRNDDPESRRPASSPAGTRETAPPEYEDRELVVERQLASLREARRSIADGRWEDAVALARAVVKEASNRDVIHAADKVLREAHAAKPGLLGRAWMTVSMGLAIFLWAALVFLVLYVLGRLGRFVVTWYHRKTWLVETDDDTEVPGIGGLVCQALQELISDGAVSGLHTSVGLLSRESQLMPPTPDSRAFPQNWDTPARGAPPSLDLKIHGVHVGSVIGWVRTWLQRNRKRLQISCRKADGSIVLALVLVHRGAQQAVAFTSAPAAASASPLSLAKEGSLKMYYLMAQKDTTLADAEAVAEVGKGLEHLGRYTRDQESGTLEQALACFTRATDASPGFDEGQVCRGIALDLLERHDEAIARFALVRQRHEDSPLARRATYNEAVSHFRKYTAEDMERANEMLDHLKGDPETVAEDPVRALAYAAQANVIAHLPIFWQELLCHAERTRDESEISRRKKEHREKVVGWVTQAQEIAGRLQLIKRDDAGSRSDDEWKQLQWACHNARGNASLNYAMSFLGRPTPPVSGSSDEPEHRQHLETALKEFQKCEALEIPGVETLSNMATAYLHLGRATQARQCAVRAITLNPDYEYAYYRLAQAWEREEKQDEVERVLRDFARRKEPRIPGFRKMYEKYPIRPSAGG